MFKNPCEREDKKSPLKLFVFFGLCSVFKPDMQTFAFSSKILFHFLA